MRSGTRRTKIVATLGPSTEDPEVIRAVLDAGVDVVRLNGAHGTHATHTRAARLVRAAAAQGDREVGVLVDLPGPKLRIGAIEGDELDLEKAAPFSLTSEGTPAVDPGVTTNVPGIGRFVAEGDTVWLADGEILLVVRRVTGDRIDTEVVRGGTLRSRKGFTVPGREGLLDPFTSADEDVLDLACDLGAELIGVSFVRTADDVERIRDALARRGASAQLVAKVETGQAVEHLDAITRASDVVMVARGDLGAQIGVTRTPLVQKEIIASCQRAGRPVITATQMLMSMTRSPVPTRAEASDVANAVLDGTDALMLSEETGVGAHPADAVATMARLAVATETWNPPVAMETRDLSSEEPVAAALARAAVQAAEESSCAAIVCRTTTGATARRIASLRPAVPIVAVTEDAAVAATLAVVWGVRSVLAASAGDDPAATVESARRAAAIEASQLVTVVANPPPGAPEPIGSVHVRRA